MTEQEQEEAKERAKDRRERVKRISALRSLLEDQLVYMNDDDDIKLYPKPLTAMLKAVFDEIDELNEMNALLKK